MRSSAMDLTLRGGGSLCLALFGVTTAFLACVVASLIVNRGGVGWASWLGRDTGDWVTFCWLILSTAVALASAWYCQIDARDRKGLRTLAAGIVLINGAYAIAFTEGRLEAIYYFAPPLILGFCGVWLWARVHHGDNAPGL